MPEELQNRIAELFAAAPEEFVKARDALVKDLKAGGDEVSAKRVKALRKPTVSVWATNLLGRRHADEVRGLLAASDALLRAQKAMLSGKQTELADLSNEERRLVSALTETAAREIGDRATPAVRDRISATLLALATDPPSRDAVLSGTLETDLQRVGFGLDPDTVPRLASLPPDKDVDARAKLKAAEDAAREARAEADRRAALVRETERSLETFRRQADDAAEKADTAEARVEELRKGL